ncbi:MAG: hypothetical protein ACOCS7_03280, partial [Halolamina sp.]
MTTTAERTSRWARRFVLAGVGFLLAWQVLVVAGAGRRTTVALGVLGFVLHTAFGKAYSLVPTYFDRDLATTRFVPAHFACSVVGTTLLAIDRVAGVELADTVGSALWCVGVALFLGTILWSVRDNPTGRETGTGTANADRRDVDRVANAFVPVALAYLAIGSYALFAVETPLPTVFDGYGPRSSHLLAAGAAGLLLFAVGFRLLPRFLVASPPRSLLWTVLPAGAIGPGLIAATLPAGPWFRVGAVVQALAVGGFALAVSLMVRESSRDRVGLYGVLAGAWAGVAGVVIGGWFAAGTVVP